MSPSQDAIKAGTKRRRLEKDESSQFWHRESQRFLKVLKSDDEVYKFSSPLELTRYILQRFSNLVVSSPAELRQKDSGIILKTEWSKDFDVQQFEDYGELVAFLKNYTSIPLLTEQNLNFIQNQINIGVQLNAEATSALKQWLSLKQILKSQPGLYFDSLVQLERIMYGNYPDLIALSSDIDRPKSRGISVYINNQLIVIRNYNELQSILSERQILDLIPLKDIATQDTFNAKRNKRLEKLRQLSILLRSNQGFQYKSIDQLGKAIARNFSELISKDNLKTDIALGEDIRYRDVESHAVTFYEETEDGTKSIQSSTLSLDDLPFLNSSEKQKVRIENFHDILDMLRQLIVYESGKALPPIYWLDLMRILSNDSRKLLAAQCFVDWFTIQGGELWHQIIQKKMELMKIFFRLQDARIEKTEQNGIYVATFRASPAIYVPLAATKESGVKTGALPGKQELYATRYDAKTQSPAGEFINQFNNELAGEKYNSANNKKVEKLKNTQKNATRLKSKPKAQYRRAGKVEAIITTTKPGTGRTGSGETEIGHFGHDEEILNTGSTSIHYEGGHLIGDQIMDGVALFNMYEDWNLVPQAKSFNNPLYITAIENAAVSAISNGAELKYKVTVKYPSNTYKVKVSNVVKNTLDPNSKMKNGDKYVDAVDKLITKDPSKNVDFTFTTRVPNYWNARVEDTKANNVLSGSARDVQKGTYSLNSIKKTNSYAPVGQEQFKYRLLIDGNDVQHSSNTPQSSLGKWGKYQSNSLGLFKYKNVNKVKVKARQKSFVQSAGISIKSLSKLDIQKIVNHKTRSQLIFSHVKANSIAQLSDLKTIKGVSAKTVKLLEDANIVP